MFCWLLKIYFCNSFINHKLIELLIKKIDSQTRKFYYSSFIRRNHFLKLKVTIIKTINSHYWLQVYQLTFYHVVMHCPVLKFPLQLEASRQNTLMLSTPHCNIFPLASPQLWLMTVEVCERVLVCRAPLLEQTFICNDTSSAMICKTCLMISATSTSTSTCTEIQGTTSLERGRRRIWASASHFTNPKGNEKFRYKGVQMRI